MRNRAGGSGKTNRTEMKVGSWLSRRTRKMALSKGCVSITLLISNAAGKHHSSKAFSWEHTCPGVGLRTHLTHPARGDLEGV